MCIRDRAGLDTLICSSEEAGSAIDSCTYADPDSEVFITVFGYTDADFSLSISSANGASNDPGSIPPSNDQVPAVTPQSPAGEGIADTGGSSGEDSGGSSGGGSLHVALFTLMFFGVARRRQLQTARGRSPSRRAIA